MRLSGQLMLAAATVAIGSHAAAEPLGRLFLTPERRALLESQRDVKVQERPAIDDATLSLDGIVSRSSGHRTVWINQQPQSKSLSDAGIVAVVSPKDAHRATIAAGDDRPVSLKVGQSVNRATGTAIEPLGDGRVAITGR